MKTAAPETKDKDQVKATLRLRMWFETADGVLFGLGRLLLLQQVAEAGSLKAAAERLGMSYRAAWGKIKATERLMGVKLIERGACNRSGYRLSDSGEALSRRYQDLFHEVERFAIDRAAKVLQFKVQGFEDSGSKSRASRTIDEAD
ncbi:MAG: LysR family transcriptional regulator [Desulfovibrionaceae bacterium]|nr:LysR family transcriptional regulator [Desulfovibrionaceae bacterium]